MERCTISIDDQLAAGFSQWIADRGYANRSEAVRDLVRRELDQQRVKRSPKGQCVASLSYVFNTTSWISPSASPACSMPTTT